jgi:hypothetical protein
VTPLFLAGALLCPVNRGQGLRGVDERDTAQGEPVRHVAAEEVGVPLPLVFNRRDEACRYPRLPFRLLQQLEVVGLAQFHLERQGLGGRHRATANSTRRGARQPGWSKMGPGE